MSFIEKLQSAGQSHVANYFFLTLSAAAGGLAHVLVDAVIPDSVANALGSALALQVIVGLALILLLLATWIVHLRLQPKPKPEVVEVRVEVPVEAKKPNRTWTEFGFWKDVDDGLDYCAKCDVTPLHRQEPGWYCVTCHYLYDDPEFKRKQKADLERRRRDEDALVRRINSGSWMS